MSRPVWLEPEPLPPGYLALDADPLLAELLYRRGIGDAATAADFLDPRRRAAPDPHRLPAMDRAVERICRALDSGERIAIYGDYDADGVTSTALLVRALRAAAGDPSRVGWRLPTRAEGYGLNPDAIAAIAAAGTTLLIAVDCGSGDHLNVAHAHAAGLDVVILDHHQMADAGPDGAIVVSPQLAPTGDYHPLAAVGVAFLLVTALAQGGCRIDGDDAGAAETDLLDYVALGTVADVAPLTGVNRALVRDGIRRIRERPRAGLDWLCRRAGIGAATLTAEQIAFKLAPRLNAAGRMADPALALRLLLSDDPREAAVLAGELEQLNALRRQESARIIAEAESVLAAQPDWSHRPLLVVAHRGWTSGVLGIAAGQLAARHGRPAIVLNDDGARSHGSARSVPGFDIAGALTRCRDLLHEHGGHSQAAGLTLASADLPRLTAALEAELSAAALPIPIEPALPVEADLPAERLTLDTARLVHKLAPFGTGNPKPLLRLRGLRVQRYAAIGRDGSHLKIHLATPRGTVQAVCWGAADRSRELVLQPAIDAVATLGIDHWSGQPRLDLELKDFRAAD